MAIYDTSLGNTNPVEFTVAPEANKTWVAIVAEVGEAALAQTLEGFRWVNDDGSEDAATFAEVQDVNISIAPDGKIRLRVIIQGPEGGPIQLDCALDGTENFWKVI